MLGSRLIPEEPDPATQPELSKAWNRMFNSSLTWVEPDLVDLVPHYRRAHFHKLANSLPSEFQDLLNATSTRYETSRGWAGASIVPDAGMRFVQIYGGWQVPSASFPPVPPGKKPFSKYYSVTWIGLDGDRRYIDATLPQVGTQQNTLGYDPYFPPWLPDYYTWFQWWAPRCVNPRLWWVRGMPVHPNDEVMGLLWAVDPQIVAIVFCNFTAQKITWFVKQAPIYAPRPRDPSFTYQPEISGASAEWIVEDPTQDIKDNKYSEPLPFADYNEVKFYNCVAGMAPEPGEAKSEKVLMAPRYKRLYEVTKGEPPRTRFVSMPERGDVEDLTRLNVKYGGF